MFDLDKIVTNINTIIKKQSERDPETFKVKKVC